MPISRSALQQPDPIVLNKFQVTDLVIKFLESKGYECKTRDESPISVDIIAKKDDKIIYIETKGNQAKQHTENKVFDSTQLRIHLSEQIETIMRLMQHEKSSVIYVAANPEIPRLLQLVGRVEKGMDILKINRFWVQPDGSISINYANEGVCI